MTDLGAFCLDLALIAGLPVMWVCISSAMFEAVIRAVARLRLGVTSGRGELGAKLNPRILKVKRRDPACIGSVGFVVPFFHSTLGWRVKPSWLAAPWSAAAGVV
ncbi:MAG: hypothetical protein WB816_03525 [Methylocystis sp.]